MPGTSAAPVASSCVAGVVVTPLARYTDERGTVSLMLRNDDPVFVGFGEVYFSSVHPGVVKAWKRHHRVTVNFACITGLIRVVAHDDRESSPTRGSTLEVVIGPDRYGLVTIPPGVWHGFAGVGGTESMLANCATEPTDPDEYDRVDVAESAIPYQW